MENIILDILKSKKGNDYAVVKCYYNNVLVATQYYYSQIEIEGLKNLWKGGPLND